MLALTLSGFLAFLKSAIFVVGYIQSSNLFPEPLSSEEEKNCIERMQNGDEEARNILIERNLRLVAIKGINSFKPDKNIRLATYAARCIENATFTCWKLMCQLVSCLIN